MRSTTQYVMGASQNQVSAAAAVCWEELKATTKTIRNRWRLSGCATYVTKTFTNKNGLKGGSDEGLPYLRTAVPEKGADVCELRQAHKAAPQMACGRQCHSARQLFEPGDEATGRGTTTAGPSFRRSNRREVMTLTKLFQPQTRTSQASVLLLTSFIGLVQMDTNWSKAQTPSRHPAKAGIDPRP